MNLYEILCFIFIVNASEQKNNKDLINDENKSNDIDEINDEGRTNDQTQSRLALMSVYIGNFYVIYGHLLTNKSQVKMKRINNLKKMI